MKPAFTLKNALIGLAFGAGAGLAASIGLLLVCGFVVGASNDYKLGQEYNAEQTFDTILLYVMPAATVLGFIIGGNWKGKP